MVKLSIITINFNNDAGLQLTIESVVKQSFINYEFLIIDGGSTDESISILKKYQNMNIHWVSEKDAGIYNAMNKGILKAKGEYILFLNSGDWLKNEHVLKKVFSSGSSADIMYGNMIINWGGGKTKKGIMPDEISLYQMYTDTLWHPVSFIKSSLFAKYGLYDESFKLVGDYEFFFRTIIGEKVSTEHLNISISVFEMDGLSSRPENRDILKSERRRVIERFLNEAQIESLEKQVKKSSKASLLIKQFLRKLNIKK
jgi:glycosyltransferase involved in cell wall biosynthesis